MHKLLAATALIAGVAYMGSKGHSPALKSYQATSSLALTETSQVCVTVNGLPDPACTSGSVDPSCTITQVKQSGYSATVRPSTNITNPEKTKVMEAYGMSHIDPKLVEGDHLVPISLCGCPGPGHSCNFDSNFWPEKWDGPTGAHVKDVTEERMLKEVRNGTITLQTAQYCLSHNWKICP